MKYLRTIINWKIQIIVKKFQILVTTKENCYYKSIWTTQYLAHTKLTLLNYPILIATQNPGMHTIHQKLVICV